jgi:hypothetical protein
MSEIKIMALGERGSPRQASAITAVGTVSS